MATKLQCEICGGKLVGKPGGIFECENCGTEYSTEWAKAKIQEITGTVKVEGTVEVTGKVQIDGPVKVEGGGPSAESLIKRGFQMLEDSDWAGAKGVFDKALEIDPENGEAFWGQYLSENKWPDAQTARLKARELTVLEDGKGCFEKARRFASGELSRTIERLREDWLKADQSGLLPAELRKLLAIHNGELRKKTNASIWKLTNEVQAGRTKIRSIDLYWLSKGLSSVTIPEGVTAIGDYAFWLFYDLSSVSIPSSVSKIGQYAFWECTKLPSVTIPDGVKEIAANAFYWCPGLQSVTFPSTLKTIGEYAFKHCSGLTSVEIPEGVTEIGFGAFQDCEKLTSVTIPRSVVKIGALAFRQDSKQVVIHAYQNSFAAKYAKENGITREWIKTAEQLAEEEAARKEAEEKRKAAAEKAEAERKAAEERAEAERKAAEERAEAKRKADREREEAERRAAEEYQIAQLKAAEEREAERKAIIEALTKEKTQLASELPNIKGMFAGSKKAKIEARLAEIEAELKKLG